MMKLQRLAGVCFAVALCSATALAEEAPAWLKQAAAAPVPTYKRDVPAVVLHDDSVITVSPDGRVTTVSTYAVRILTREGRTHAEALAYYETGSDKIKEMRAWLLRPDGTVRKLGKDETIDRAVSLDDVYNESRARVISAETDADAGCVFGFQKTTEERSLFPQIRRYFQVRIPVLSSRLTMTLPEGWRAKGIMFNHAAVEPTVSGSSYTWELRNLAPIEPEPASPEVTTLAPHLAVNFAPPNGATAPGGRTFDTWADVSAWYSELADPQSEPDDAIAIKARELVAGAKTELEKIQIIGRFVQGIQYISIQIGIGGYRPHRAAEVFAKKYGDCKDKAALMRAMLRAVGLKAYAVLIYSGDRTYVREEWASPTQFNHCIVAVRVSDETQAASVVVHPSLGRLLVFDATDADTPVGDLPYHEQGSFALVAAGGEGSLVRMPVTPPEANRLEREADVVLARDGSISAVFRERSQGQSAVSERGAFKQLSRPGYTKMIEGWITAGGATLAKVSKIEPSDDHTAGRFALDVEFTADRYAQDMQGQLLIFKPVIVSRTDFYAALGDDARRHPVVLESRAYNETVRVRLPEGFDVDELPESVKLDSAFGSYAASYEVKDGHFVFTRSFVQRAATIPAEQYRQVRDFFGRIRAAEDSPVVLAKK
ncbi:MAG TPA: DUF3857 and transglutaminase domain-containing protein [Pyrinomonadaceae bacterium]|nr:DUF3857 and transglutaminase domain-containing protein [Pyrinomonadaceae bacterium]